MKDMNRREALKLAGAAPVLLAASVNADAEPTATAGPSPIPAVAADSPDPWIEISLANLSWNLARIRRQVGGRPVMAVIKANAYGHGVVEVGKHLEAQGVKALAVGKVSEALALRESGVKTPILNFGPFSSAEADALVRADVAQSVFTDQAALLAEAARKVGRKAKVHLKIDTGLGRVGVPSQDALPFVADVTAKPEIAVEGVFTALTEEEEFDRIQVQRLMEVAEHADLHGVPLGLRHAASSAAVLSFPASFLDMVRPGITIYGEYPSDKEYAARKIDLRPAMMLKAKVVYAKTLRAGDSVSYHRAFTATKDTDVVTLPVGYSDGYPYQVAGKGEVIIGGRRHPIIDVTANHTTVRLAAGSQVNIGDEAVLLGQQGSTRITAQELAGWTGTSSYKTLIQMSPQLPRKTV